MNQLLKINYTSGCTDDPADSPETVCSRGDVAVVPTRGCQCFAVLGLQQQHAADNSTAADAGQHQSVLGADEDPKLGRGSGRDS